jgi:hypothetical protein
MFTKVRVDGYEYMVSHPDPEVAWATGVQLTKLAAEPLIAVGVAAAGDGKKKLADMSDEERAAHEEKLMKGVMGGVRALLANLEPEKSFSLIRTILSTVEVQGEIGKEPKKMVLNDDGHIKMHFKGRMGSMLKLAVEVVKFTHEDFFSAIRNGVAETMEGLKK